jgi:pyruvate dehydrogenase E2 component (dihydrolipoamide acetyltransferase)
MAVEIVMPRMGLTMEEGTVVAWLKQEGQPVAAGEPLLEIETDKSTVEIESPGDGVMGQVLAGPGETVPVGQVIGFLLKHGENAPTAQSPSQLVITRPRPEGGKGEDLQQALRKAKASPAARTLAQKLGVDLAEVLGTGPGGRVVAWNVNAFSEKLQPNRKGKTTVKASPIAQKVAAELEVDLSGVQGSGLYGRITRSDVEKSAQIHSPQVLEAQPSGDTTPLSRQQKIMAERMASSFQSAPHFYLHVEVDMRAMVALRQKLQDRLEKKFDIHLTYTDLLIRFCAQVLAKHPEAMAQWSEKGLVAPVGVNIGIATDAPNGLIVPVIHNADRLGLVDISQRRQGLGQRAKEGKLLPQDLELGVFTLSNLGMYGIDSFDAILNPPQAAILAVGRIKDRALVVDGAVIPAPMMNLSLSVDHRVLDGAKAARFLGELVEWIETPELALV